VFGDIPFGELEPSLGVKSSGFACISKNWEVSIKKAVADDESIGVSSVGIEHELA
jgi:hypothetical protein